MRKKLSIIFAMSMLTMLLTACVGDEIPEKDNIKWTYEKRIASIVLENVHKNDDSSDGSIYVTFNVVLLDKEGEILFKKEFTDELIEAGEKYDVDLEDVIPEWITYDKVHSMEVEIKRVNDYQ